MTQLNNLGSLILMFCMLIGVIDIQAQNSLAAPAIKISEVSNQDAAPQTQALYHNLKKYASSHILFGQEDALAYGLNWREDKDRSDIKDVSGSHPALIGWDLSKLGQTKWNIDTVDFRKMRKWMKKAYKMGCVNTISWHLDNPKTGGSTWDKTPAVASILPGGEKHDFYLSRLDLVAKYIRKLRTGFLASERIPIIFRPFHEHTGSWFWWGKDHCTPEEYVQLWRFTADYLREKKGLNNLLFAYSPDGTETEEEYMERYPGDDYVDIMGFDYYIHNNEVRKNPEELVKRVKVLVDLAERHDKIPAITESGFETIPDPDFWTDFLLSSFKSDPAVQKIAYFMVWRNARKDHHYGPYPGHQSAENFNLFQQDDMIWLQRDLPNLYKVY